MRGLEFYPCGEGNSLFRLIDYVTRTPVCRLLPLHRTCTLVRKMGVETVTIERFSASDIDRKRCPDRVYEERKALAKRLGVGLKEFESIRITFVRKSIGGFSELESLPDEDFLAYVVVNNMRTKDGWRSYVFESVVREPGRHLCGPDGTSKWVNLLNNYVHVKRVFTGCVGPVREYQILGNFFCQQNGVTSVCAHACAAMTINNTIADGKLVSCEDVNRFIGINHEKRAMFSRYADNTFATNAGLSLEEMLVVLRRCDLSPVPFECKHPESRYYFRHSLYGCVESRMPALLVFTSTTETENISQHVVCAVGHTLNSDSWFPGGFAAYAGREAKSRLHLSTLDWVPDFIVHDDNFGMFFCLPGHAFRPEEHADPGIRFTPQIVIGVSTRDTVPELRNYQAEGLAFLRLFHLCSQSITRANQDFYNKLLESYYFRHLLCDINSFVPVFRTVLVRRSEYLAHLEEKDYDKRALRRSDVEAFARRLRNHSEFWLVEVTDSDLYVGNKSKIVDILVDSQISAEGLTDAPRSTKGIILMRFPGALVVPKGTASRRTLPPYSVARELPTKSHCSLFTPSDCPDRPPEAIW